ncbi:MAG TPA: electron transfer flavoprotein subunit beta/FixA family protein [candidate division WOR-3 bacterium]|uniref:Electron transfer flavoprotein subunit beta/FixA family protein n=1 Tax=candidate division WOR-3 bacterium TaxID=2052148 RepID=A0A7C0VBU0_UNCW3|nr:electron transfer flavoprotein subunit beta/FixA family protein [candidate division WOR-3 bacterium]
MRIVVCVKQVPDPENAKMDWETGTVVREGVKNIINPFDLYAIEEALRIKEKLGGEVIVISMGPPQAEEALREAIAMGADKAILITSRDFAGADTLATSYTLSQAIKKIGEVDLIICGKQAIDGDTAQVGPGVSAHLDLPQITFVGKIDEITEDRIRAERMVEGGYQVVESPLPCVITVVKDINIPRLPSLKGKIAAKKAEIPQWGPEDIDADPKRIGAAGSPTMVEEVFAPELKKEGRIYSEDQMEEAIEKVIEAMEKMGVL